jgi:hypothetical protein
MSRPEPMTWRKSSYSGGGENCVEVGQAGSTRAIRDTKLGAASPVIAVPDTAFTALLARLRTASEAQPSD